MSPSLKSIDEIRALVAGMPEKARTAVDTVRAREAMLTKPPGALGRLEAITTWLAAWQDRAPPSVARPAVLVFAGNHGIAELGVSAYPAAVTAQMVANFEAGGAAVNQLCKTVGATFAVLAIELERPTGNITAGPAMHEADFVAAFQIGFDAIPDGVDLLGVGEMGIGNTTIAAALSAALFGGTASDWIGRGTGVDDAGLARKLDAIDLALDRHAG
ncbi:MAG: nicotinate-nucleotide--dimethylbenzimidazole phosphoribosyltransferase, partial [Proteobacteria bacterium]|nr:nicotinate-nucleotide--dimethylbenzimidazole phosphoribosyltransferase [Pseudomonadota bacterium]